MIVIVKTDDSADFDHRITFWNGKRFVAEYPNAAEYMTVSKARTEYQRALDKHLREGLPGDVAAIEDYGLDTERKVF